MHQMLPTKSLHEKRDDLQCWRALSILAVLLFHIWPEHFPNGYLGVDIFFVLSGYLMANLYSFEKNLVNSTIDFYYRRVKRILPIYLLMIILTLIILSQQIFPEQFNFIIEDSRWAIALATNYEDLLKQRGYFETEANFRFFRHCWSLAVEMQFYLIFPFLAISRTYISPKLYQLLLITILITSILFQAYSSNPIVQYESLFCRIWQFSFGMLAQTLPILSIKWFPSFMLIIITVIMFCTVELSRLWTSFFTISMVATVISMSTAPIHPFKTLCPNPSMIQHLVILGDVSYLLYLIHWPLITYTRFMSSSIIFSYFDGFMLFSTSIFLSKIGHIIVEKPILRLSNSHKNLSIILILFYAAVICVPEKLMLPPINNSKPSDLTLEFWKNITNFDTPLYLSPKWTTKNDIEVAVKLRGEFMGGGMYACRDQRQFRHRGMNIFYCEVAGNPNATMTALVIGNSFSMNIVSAVSANPLFSKTISIWTNGRNFPMHDALETYFMDLVIKQRKPDVTFIVQRYYHKYLYSTPINQIPEHPEFKHWNKILEIISNYTSAIIINKEQLVFSYDISQDYIRRRFYDLYLEPRLKNPPKSETLEAWLTSLDCPKCQFFDYRVFCDGNFCNIIDLATGLPLFRDTEHISPIGLRFLKPYIDTAINKALKIENE